MICIAAMLSKQSIMVLHRSPSSNEQNWLIQIVKHVFLCLTCCLFIQLNGLCQKSNWPDKTLNIILLPNKDVNLPDIDYESALDAIHLMLESRGLVLKDLDGILQQGDLKRQLSDQIENNIFKLIIENAKPDIIITAKIVNNKIDKETQVYVSLLAKDSYTAERIASTGTLKSTRRMWSDYYSPTREALMQNGAVDSFCNQLNNKIFSLIENGRLIDIQIEVKHVKKIELNQSFGNSREYLSEMIFSWIKENAVDSFINIIALDSSIARLETRLPVVKNEDQPLSPSEWGIQLERYIKMLLEKNDPLIKVSSQTIGSQILVYIE